MNRRRFLTGAATAASLALGGRLARPPPERLAIKLWGTPEALAYPAAMARAASYLQSALEAAGAAVDLSLGDEPVAFEIRNDDRIERAAWPRRVLAGAVGLAALEPAVDVNLLLTDGDAARDTAVYALPHVAAVPGARHLSAMPSVTESESTDASYSAPAAVTQLVLHEVGHALGLGHGHGSVKRRDGAVVASPMIGGYAWADGNQWDAHAPGGSASCAVTRPPDGERWLSMRYSACAERAIRSYRGGLLRVGVAAGSS